MPFIILGVTDRAPPLGLPCICQTSTPLSQVCGGVHGSVSLLWIVGLVVSCLKPLTVNYNLNRVHIY